MITCVTLSANLMPRDDLPDGVEYLIHVSQFSDAAGLHNARLDALARVQTEGFIFVDDDDQFPEGVRMPAAALLIGNERNPIRFIDKSKWPRDRFVKKAMAAHKAVGRTAAAHAILPHLPRGEFYTEGMLYPAMIELGGYEYDPAFLYSWKPRRKGMHTKVRRAIANTKSWLENKMPDVVANARSSM